MEESEEEIQVGVQIPQPSAILPPPLQAMLFSAVGEFLVALGILFCFVGAAAFITDLLRIKGSGETVVGLILIASGFILLKRSKLVIKTIQRPMTPEMSLPPSPQQPKNNNPTSYR